MGERTTVDSSARANRQRAERPVRGLVDLFAVQTDARPAFESQVLTRRKAGPVRVDLLLILSVATLIIIGLVMVYSASYDFSYREYDDPSWMFMRQVLFLGVGLIVATGLALIDFHHLKRAAIPMILITLAALVGVLITDEIRHGATRTLLEGSIQPSELAKLVVIIYLAVWLEAKRDSIGSVSFGLIPLGIILGTVSGLIALQPDFSAVITILIMGGLMFFMAGGEPRQIIILLLLIILVGLIVLQFYPVGMDRILLFIAGLIDPTQGSDQVKASLESFLRGGWFGVGIGNAQTKYLDLPVPFTDSIFAVVGEETGVIGSVALVALYSLLLWRGMTIARQASDKMGTLLAAGLTLWICIEAFINMAMMVNLLPIVGNALPYISLGGSSLNVSLAAIGILLSISRFSHKQKEESGRQTHAAVNLRRRDGRRSVSGSNRLAKTGD
ncbi:MAG: cell division protein FtsW [Anaerolineales bacterium]|nr:cell division protein FtsW [Anaerolineales bacterium]